MIQHCIHRGIKTNNLDMYRVLPSSCSPLCTPGCLHVFPIIGKTYKVINHFACSALLVCV